MARKIGDRKGIVLGAVVKIVGQSAADRIASAIGQFRFEYAGGAGADEHAYALMSVFCGGSTDRCGKVILHQRKQCQPVIAAVECGEMRRNLNIIHAGNLADKGIQIYRLERAWRKTTAAAPQRIKCLFEATTDTAGRGEMGE